LINLIKILKNRIINFKNKLKFYGSFFRISKITYSDEKESKMVVASVHYIFTWASLSVTLSFSMVHQELYRRLQVIQPFVPDTDIRAEGV